MTVLNVVEADGNVWLYSILLFLGAVMLLAGAYLSTSDYYDVIGPACIAAGIVIGTILILTGSVLLAVRNPHKRYEVIIDENTTFYEIYDKYDVIKQEGYIYTLIDKEKEK